MPRENRCQEGAMTMLSSDYPYFVVQSSTGVVLSTL